MDKKRILVVDDDPVVLEMVNDYLKDRGYEVFLHDRALGTLNEIKKVRADLIVLNVNMPALKGNKICDLIRKDGQFPLLKVLLYSVLDEKELEKMAKEQGADDFLRKSGNLSELGVKVQTLLSQT